MKISIVTACYNSVSTILDTLRSIQMQTHQDIEHIVIDGGSSDGTLEILEQNIEHIAVLISEPDKGLYDAMNKGISKATGDVIGMLNSDDLFANRNALAMIVNKLSDPSIDACYGDLIYVKCDDIDQVVRYWKSSEYKPDLFSKGWVPAHPTFYVRKSIHDKHGILFNTNYELAADYDIFLRLLFTNKINVAYIPEVLVKMRLGGATNKSLQNIINQNRESIQILKSHDYNCSPIKFICNKFINRVQQYYKRYSYVG